MELREIEIEKLNAAAYNPRKDLQPGDPEYEKLKKSINQFGYIQPIIWNEKTGNVVGGHQRLKVLINELGLAKVPAIVVSLSDSQEKAANIALNKISGDWDLPLLKDLLLEIDTGEFDIEVTGFDYDEIDDLIKEIDGELNVKEEKDFDIDKEEERAEEFQIARPGDIWILGDHRLMCGDSTNENHIADLMAGQRARLIITDPPYNVDYEGTAGKIMNDKMADRAFYEFLLNAHRAMFQNAEQGCPIYVFHADSEGLNFRKAFQNAGFKLAQCLVWKKNALVMGRQDYHWIHEPILYGWREGKAHWWYGERNKTTVIDDDIDLKKLNKKELVNIINELRNDQNTTIILQDKPTKNDVHPTMKPLQILRRLLDNSSKRADIVLDPFGGSGATLIACEQMKRSCRTNELDPKYATVIINRFINFKGDTDDVFLLRDRELVPHYQVEQERI